MKHIDIIYRFIRETMFDELIELVNIDGKLNPIDALMKFIHLEIFRQNCANMQVLHG